MPAIDCPRGHGPLVLKGFGRAEVHVCDTCEGVLVPQRCLIPFLESVTKEMLQDMGYDEPIQSVRDKACGACCPGCGEVMEAFGYMGTHLASCNRCSGCSQLWIDPEQLAVVAILYARTQVRRQARQAHQDAERESLNRRVNLMLRTRMRTGTAMIAVG